MSEKKRYKRRERFMNVAKKSASRTKSRTIEERSKEGQIYFLLNETIFLIINQINY